MSSLVNAALGSQGLKSTWEGGAATQAALAQQQQNQASLNNYIGQTNGLNNYSGAIAGTDYNAAAQAQYQNQQANYGQQQQAAGMLYNQATGNAPSMADLQMQAGLGQANNSVQSAMLSQQGGVSPGLSQRNMLGAQAQQNAAIVSSGAANRAQELSTAQNNYANLLGNMGQTAAGMTNQQYQMGQQNYNQAMGNLNYQTQNANTALAAQNAYTATNYGANMANVQGQSAANNAQYQAMGNTIDSAASFLNNSLKQVPVS